MAMANLAAARMSDMSPPTDKPTTVVDVTKLATTAEGDDNGLKRDITTRHMVLLAISGSVGAGLFVGSGQALAAGGPGNLVVAFALVGAMVGSTMASLGEMATSYPVAGAFYDYTVRFVGPQVGFAMGWNFVFSWLIVLPFELASISAQLTYWSPDLQPYVFVGPFLAFLAVISFSGGRWFAELEHWLGLCKTVAISTFICFALAVTAAGVPGDARGALHARYWTELPPFRHGVQGFLAVFRIAGMAYGGTEMLGLTVAECRRPHRVMPLATKVVFFRIAVFYVGALLMLGFCVPSDSDSLASVGHGAKYSPFAVAARLAHVDGLGHFFSACIVAALVSMANTSAFASSRALQALCRRGMGPSLFARVTERRGVPGPGLVLAFAVALLALVTSAPGGGEIFDWLLSLSGISSYMTWGAICWSHIRMRRAMAVQGQHPRDLIFQSPLGVAGSWVGLGTCGFGLCAQVVVAAWPMGGHYAAKSVVRDVLGIVFMGVLFSSYRLYRRVRHGETRLLVPLEDVDLATGLRTKAFAAASDREAADEKWIELAALGWCEEWSWSQKAVFRVKKALHWPLGAGHET